MRWQIDKTRELGGEGIAIYSKILVSWVFTPVLGECGVLVERNAIFPLETGDHFCEAVFMWGGSIHHFLLFWLVCLEVATSLRAVMPTSSDARLVEGPT